MGLRIKEIIKEQGITQQEFADRMGISRVGLSQLINGKPSYTTLEKIAELLNVPMWQLFVSPEDVQKPNKPQYRCPNCGEPLNIRID